MLVTDAMGNASSRIELRDHAAKMGSGRTVPMNALLHDALVVWRAKSTRQRSSHRVRTRWQNDGSQHRDLVCSGV